MDSDNAGGRAVQEATQEMTLLTFSGVPVVERTHTRSTAMRDNRESLVRKLLNDELPELLADYEHLAADSDGKIDPFRKKRIRRSENCSPKFG
jgi:hypothetical protein